MTGWTEGAAPRTGGAITEKPAPSETRIDVRQLRQNFASLRDEARVLHDDTAHGHQRVRRIDLDQRAAKHGRRPLTDVLTELSDLGFSWRDIARAVGVSVPALRKWRQGEPATPVNRTRAARLLGTCEYLLESVPGLGDIAGWFELPLVVDSAITPLDMYSAGREDLVLDYAEQPELDPDAILARFDPDWRERRSSFEVVVAEDGLPSIQRRQ